MATVSAIANASQGELLCITYEILLEAIEEARLQKGEQRQESINKALNIIKALTEDLNFEVPLAQELFRLYVYVQGVLLQPQVAEKELEQVYKVIDTIYQGFAEVARSQVETASSMQNVQTVYAGMTYGKNDLNEMVIKDKNRGFKA